MLRQYSKCRLLVWTVFPELRFRLQAPLTPSKLAVVCAISQPTDQYMSVTLTAEDTRVRGEKGRGGVGGI